MDFFIRYIFFYYKLAIKTRDRIKAPGLIMLGKLGDKIYKLPFTLIVVNLFITIELVLFSSGYAAQVMPSNDILGLNFILVAPFFLCCLMIFDWFAFNKQLCSYFQIYRLTPITNKKKAAILFVSELLGVKLILLTTCLSIIMLFNIFYLGYSNSSLMLVIMFYLAIYIVYNSVISLNLVVFKNITDKNVIYSSLVIGVIIYVAYTFYYNLFDLNFIETTKHVFNIMSTHYILILGIFMGSILVMICSFYVVQKLFDLKWDLSG